MTITFDKLKRLFVFLLLVLFMLVPLAKAQFYFGKNKINYERLDWHVLESENLNIYYYQGEEEIATLAQEIAEEAYDEYEVKFNLTIDRKIPLIVYSNPIYFQQTNVIRTLLPEGVGGFFEYMKGRVVLPFTGDRRDFYHVVRHELVHVFTNYKISETATRVGQTEGAGLPLWFTEGIAEYWSTGFDSEAEMFIRDAILHDYLLPLNSNQLYFSGFLLYKEGQSFLQYYDKNYGAERIRMLLTDYWKYKSFDDAISAISGKSFNVIMQEWQLALKKRYSKYIHQKNIKNFDIRDLANRNIQVAPTFFQSDSSQQLIYMSNKWGFENIVAQDKKSKSDDILIRGNKKPKFESLHILRTRISVNPQGQLAFVAKSGGNDVIWIYDIKNKTVHKTIKSSTLTTVRSPVWNRNGSMLTFTAQDTAGFSDIYVWNKNDDEIIRLTHDLYGDTSPTFSPDNRYVVFSSDRGEQSPDANQDLFLYELETGDVMQLTSTASDEKKPFWHPSKMNMIYYISDSSGTDNLWCAELHDSETWEGTTVRHQQLSDYYSGVNDIQPMSTDSLILSTFSRYNYHLNTFKADSVKASFDHHIAKYEPIEKEPAAELPARERVSPYRLKYSIDFAQSSVAYDPIFGMLGGAQISISDMLGNRYYNFLLANTARTSSEFMDHWNFAATMVDLKKRANRAVTLFHFANDYYTPYEGFFYERTVGVRGALNYPINIFNRMEFSTSFWHSKKDLFTEIERKYLVANFISFVHDNSMWIYTGPIDGWRMRVAFGPTFNLQSSQINSYTLLGDFRYYYRLGRSVSFAHRTMGMMNEGENIRRFYIGGSWFLRGYDIRDVYGKKFILFNNELRFPIAQSLMINFTNGRIGFAPVRGALFVDAGNAWDFEFPGFIGSFGLGLRATLMRSIVLRLDIGKRTDFEKVQKNLFVKFFFGWNY